MLFKWILEIYNLIWKSWYMSRHDNRINCNAMPTMGLLPDTSNCGLRMRQECRERFLATWTPRQKTAS